MLDLFWVQCQEISLYEENKAITKFNFAMKKLCIIFILIMPWFSILKSQCNHSLDSFMYERAYNYIVTDSLFGGKPINVSRELIGSCYSCFFNELKENQDIQSCYIQLIELDKKICSN
jgi:hypothetical protein